MHEEKKIAQAVEGLDKLIEIIESFSNPKGFLKLAQLHLADYRQLKEEGYLLKSTAELKEDCQKVERAIVQELKGVNGESLLLLLKDYEDTTFKLIATAKVEITLRANNIERNNELLSLQNKLSYLFDEAQAAQETIDQFAPSNGIAVNGNLEKALVLRSQLLEQDEFEKLNSMEVQAFEKLHERIEQSIQDTEEIIGLLNDIIAHKDTLLKLQKELPYLIKAAEEALEQANGYAYCRQYYGAYIKEAENHLHSAKVFAQAGEIIHASTHAKEAEQKATMAYNSAVQKQIAEENAAYQRQKEAQREALSAFLSAVATKRKSSGSTSWSSSGKPKKSSSSSKKSYGSGGRSSSKYSSGGRSSGGGRSGGRSGGYGSGGRV